MEILCSIDATDQLIYSHHIESGIHSPESFDF